MERSIESIFRWQLLLVSSKNNFIRLMFLLLCAGAPAWTILKSCSASAISPDGWWNGHKIPQTDADGWTWVIESRISQIHVWPDTTFKHHHTTLRWDDSTAYSVYSFSLGNVCAVRFPSATEKWNEKIEIVIKAHGGRELDWIISLRNEA